MSKGISIEITKMNDLLLLEIFDRVHDGFKAIKEDKPIKKTLLDLLKMDKEFLSRYTGILESNLYAEHLSKKIDYIFEHQKIN